MGRAMEINLLALNVGNSRLAIGVFRSGNLEYVTRIAHEQRADWAGKIAEAWKQIETMRRAAYDVPWSQAVLHALELTAY